ncbi:hypothetical protein KSP39_PZI018581 [Platanthera zijinensis]|uniref:Uncharacterized protein n=1 Tax=Platanthera zijinensis TaxID=2320716 RepID=A0AAP0FYP5_9ASPA
MPEKSRKPRIRGSDPWTSSSPFSTFFLSNRSIRRTKNQAEMPIRLLASCALSLLIRRKAPIRTGRRGACIRRRRGSQRRLTWSLVSLGRTIGNQPHLAAAGEEAGVIQ